MGFKPITFACEATFPISATQIANQILDLTNWTDFKGYGPLPGIAHAEFDLRTPEIVGTRIRVNNQDGSSHVEEIREWNPEQRLRLFMHEFKPPLSRLACGFDEIWVLERDGANTKVTRSFNLHPKSAIGRLVLWGISFLLQRAITNHLKQMGDQFAIISAEAGTHASYSSGENGL